jgi:hypothetical protein
MSWRWVANRRSPGALTAAAIARCTEAATNRHVRLLKQPTSEWAKITGPNLLALIFSVSVLAIKQFGRLFCA